MGNDYEMAGKKNKTTDKILLLDWKPRDTRKVRGNCEDVGKIVLEAVL
jgi:hypothetical protein